MENSESIKSDALRLGSGQHKVNVSVPTLEKRNI